MSKIAFSVIVGAFKTASIWNKNPAWKLIKNDIESLSNLYNNYCSEEQQAQLNELFPDIVEKLEVK